MHRNLLTQLPDRPGYIANETPLILKKQNPLGVIDLHSFGRFAAIRMGKGGPGTFYAESPSHPTTILIPKLTASTHSRPFSMGNPWTVSIIHKEVDMAGFYVRTLPSGVHQTRRSRL